MPYMLEKIYSNKFPWRDEGFLGGEGEIKNVIQFLS